MENQMIEQRSAELQSPSRDIETVTTEIRSLVQQAQQLALVYAIEIGRRLYEAKSLLPHGEWGGWLKENVPFSQSTANNLMKIFDEYGADQISIFGAEANSQTLGNLPYTKALKLLAIPADEREEFVENNDVESLSSRELEQLIKERDAAKEDADALREELDALKAAAETKTGEADDAAAREEDLRKQLEEAQKKAQKAKEDHAKAKAEIKRMQESTEIPKDLRAKLRAELKKELAKDQQEQMDKAITDFQKRIDAAQAQRKEAEAAALEAKARADELEKRLKTASPAVAVFQSHYEQVQGLMIKCRKDIDEIAKSDAETASKLALAMQAAFNKLFGG